MEGKGKGVEGVREKGREWEGRRGEGWEVLPALQISPGMSGC